jgi:DNA-binding CsgD family transcriptional regulator
MIAMTFHMLFVYAISTATAVITFMLAYKMWRNYPERYLTYLFYYVVLFIVGNFISRTISEIIPSLLNLSKWQAEKFYVFQGTFLLRPLAIIDFYLLIMIVVGMLGKKLSRKFNWFYFLFWGIHWSILFILLMQYLTTKQRPLAGAIMVYVTDLLYIFILLYAGAYLAFNAKDIKDRGKRIAARWFGILWFAGVLFFNLSGVINPGRTVVLALGFAKILPALVFLYIYLKKYYREHPAWPEEDAELREVFSKYNISQREEEIIRLVSKGKSNQEISNALYISLQTVKHHIHSIYRKLSIKNRVQLANFIRNSIKN